MQHDSPSAPAGKSGIRLTFTSLLTILVVVLGSISAAYVYGVMTGRKAITAPASVQKPAAQSLNPVPAQEIVNILRPQDLQYAQVLRGEEKKTPPAASKVPAAPSPASGTPQNPLPAVSENEHENDAGTPLEEGTEIYDHIFQVAALRDAQGADQLREVLEGYGLRTRMERSGQYFLVIVPLRGNSKRAYEIVELARSLRLGEPLLRSRKLVRP